MKMSAPQKARPYTACVLEGELGQRTFSGIDALQVAMPLGGIGAGCICVNGYGGLQDFSIRNKPDVSALLGSNDAAFAVVHIKGRRPVTRLIEGPMPRELVYNQGIKGNGGHQGGQEGLPRFERCTFKGEFPFGQVSFSDPDVPLKTTLTGWNPFIPRDDLSSGIPCAILEYSFENRSKRRVDIEFSYNMSNFAGCGEAAESARSSVIPGAGILFGSEVSPNHKDFGSATLMVVGRRPSVKAAWLRSGNFDTISALWRELSTGTLHPNKGTEDARARGRSGGTIQLKDSLKPGEKVTYPIVITWHFPNCHYSFLHEEACSTCGDGECDTADRPPAWRPFYASRWKDAADVAEYVRKHYKNLRARTMAFKMALFSSTVPSYVIDAVSANLAIVKSPTVLRQENGNMWAWEGCCAMVGCCAGLCTHVWNYAQAFPHLFPQLERTLRELEFERSMNRRGHVDFRSALPDGPTPHRGRAASDGQLGGIMKLFRDYQICGDLEWLKRLYPLAKRSLDYCIRAWDPDRKGVLIEPHHNTYDIEFWGPESMCSSIYLGALVALARMGREVGRPDDAPSYEKLAAKGAEYLDKKLFNGQYYEQKLMYKGLKDTSFMKMVARVTGRSSEMLKLLRREGPRAQFGKGCLSDGVLGAWMATIYGIGTPLSRAHVRRHLKSVFEYNFRPDLKTHACPQRPGYAMGHEPGLLLCSWPRGGKPTLPFPYSDEVWTGIEYQVASHLIEAGLVDEGLTIVRAARSRHDGRTRNPWNEYECGSYYARAMSSYALLGSLSGLRYSAPDKTLRLDPKLDGKKHVAFLSTASGFGTVTLSGRRLSVEIVEGELAVDEVRVRVGGKTLRKRWGVVARAGRKVVLKLAAH